MAGEDPRDVVAAVIAAALAEVKAVDRVFIDAANSGGPMVRIILPDSTIFNITITKVRGK